MEAIYKEENILLINLEEVKKEIIRRVENIEYDVIEVGIEDVKKSLDALNVLKNSDLLLKPIEEVTTIETAITETKKHHGSILREGYNSEFPDLPEHHYIFQKRMFGGILLGLPDVQINERMCRDMALESGDMIYFRGFHDIRLVERKKKDIGDQQHVLYPLCEVKANDKGTYYCDTTFSSYDAESEEPLMINGEPFTYYIPYQIVDSMRLDVGGFVDLAALHENDPRMKVVWRHEVDDYSKPRTSGFYKDNSEVESTATEYDIDLQGYKVLIVGIEARRMQYKHLIERLNGTFMFIDGESHLGRIYTACNRADVILILKDYMGHPPVNKTVEHCKDIEKPFKVVDGLGLKRIALDAEELVNQIPVEVES